MYVHRQGLENAVECYESWCSILSLQPDDIVKLRFHIARCHQAIGEYQDLCHELNVQVMAQARAVAQAAALDVRKPGLLVSDTSSAFVPSTGQGYAEAIDAAAVRQASAVMFGTAVGSEVERSEAAAAAARARARARAAAARSKQQEQAAADANGGGGGESGVAEDGPQQRHVAAVGAVNLLCLRANAIKQRTLALALLHEQVCGSVWQCVAVCVCAPVAVLALTHPSRSLCVLLLWPGYVAAAAARVLLHVSCASTAPLVHANTGTPPLSSPSKCCSPFNHGPPVIITLQAVVPVFDYLSVIAGVLLWQTALSQTYTQRGIDNELAIVPVERALAAEWTRDEWAVGQESLEEEAVAARKLHAVQRVAFARAQMVRHVHNPLPGPSVH